MPRSRPYHPYRNIRLNRRPRRQQSFVFKTIHLQQPKTENDVSGSRFAIVVILFAFAMIIGGLTYMLTKNATDIELLKSLAR